MGGEEGVATPALTASRRPRSRSRYAIRLALSLVLVTVILRLIGWDLVWGALASASVTWLIVMYGLKLLRQVIDAVQFRYLTRRIGLDLRLGRIFLASQLASFYSLLVPGEFAASAVKWANLSIATGKRSLVLNAMVYMKLLFMGVPILIGSIALAIHNPLGSGWLLLIAIGAMSGVAASMVILYHPRVGAVADRALRRVAARLRRGVREKLEFVLDSMKKIRAMDLRNHLALIAFVSLGVSVEILRFHMAIRAIGLQVPVLGILWILAFTGLIRLLPISIAGLGVREGVLVVALSVYGVAAQDAVAVGLLGFSGILLLALIGAGYQVALAAGWARAAPPVASEVANGTPPTDETPSARP